MFSQLSTIRCLTKTISMTSSLPQFTPALGHTYPLADHKPAALTSSFKATQSTGTAAGTPRPETQDTSTTKISSLSKVNTIEDVQGTQLLESSYDLLLRYGNEYMDENPLIGEPGSFKLSKTREFGLAAVSAAAKTADQPFKATPKKTAPAQIQTETTDEGKNKRSGAGSGKSPTTPGFKKKKERRKSRIATSDDVSTPKASTPQAAEG